LLHFGMV